MSKASHGRHGRIAWAMVAAFFMCPNMVIAQDSKEQPPAQSPPAEAPPADAPPSEPPATQPPPPATTPDEEAERMRRRTNAADESLTPSKVPTSAPAGGKPKASAPESGIPVPRARRAREGVFVVKQAGELLVARTGDVVFIPDRDAPARTSRPMVLLPCQAMARLESAAGLKTDVPTADRAPRPRVILTGQVMVYRQREYLLPSVFQVEVAPKAAPVPEKDAPRPAANERGAQDPQATDTPAAEEQVAGDSGQDKEVESFIRELEDRRTKNRGLSRETALAPSPEAASNTPAATGAEPTGTDAVGGETRSWPLAEGSVITARRVRLVHFSDGAPGISFDNGAGAGQGAGGARRVEAPMALLACQLSQRLEEIVGARGDKAAIEISGRVFSYGNRNYLLPTMYQVLPPTDVGPLN